MAQFWRRTEIVNDTGVFQAYPDLFIGQEDTIDIKGGTSNRRGIFEFQVADSPTFGDAVITAVRPNLYINSVSLNESTELPRYKGYVFKTQLSDLDKPSGNLAIKDESTVVIQSTIDGSGTWLEERFDSTPRQVANNFVELKVDNGTVTRKIDQAILVNDLVDWLLEEDITGGDGDPNAAWYSPRKYALTDLAEYSDDFDEHIANGKASLTQWLVANYAIKTEGMTGFDMDEKSGGWLGRASAGATAGALAGGAATFWSGGWGAIPGSVIGAAAGMASTNRDAWVEQGGSFAMSGDNWIIPLEHKKNSGKRDWYQPKKTGASAKWWVLSKKLEESDKVKMDIVMTKSVESDLDQNLRIHPGNSVFDTVRRQKTYWIADPESYDNEIEAVKTRALFTTTAGYEGQGAELTTHWRFIDSSEVADKGVMTSMSAKDGEKIDNRQELMMSYGHIPRPNERDVYHAGAFDVDAQGSENAIATHDTFAGYASADEASRDTLIYEKMLDSKVATKVSFTTNLQDLEYAWVEANMGSGSPVLATNSRCPKNSHGGLISSRRGFFCTLSRNPVKNGKNGQVTQTFADYLIDNRAPVKDANTGHSNIPGTFVLGFLNFPTDENVQDWDPDNQDEGGATWDTSSSQEQGDLGYIHKQRQNKISVVWHDYWDSEYLAGKTTGASNWDAVGWQISSDFNEGYQGVKGIDAKGYYDIRWMGLANGQEDQSKDRMVLLDPDTWYTIDMYMHPKVPFIRVHITDTATGKRLDNNKIQMWPGPYNMDSLKTIKAGSILDSAVNVGSGGLSLGGTSFNCSGATGIHANKFFPVGSTVYSSTAGAVVGTVKSSTKTFITLESDSLVAMSQGDALYYSTGNDEHSRMGDESRWPAYCSFWLNNTHWRSSNQSASAAQGWKFPDTRSDFDWNEPNGVSGGATTRGTPAKANHVDFFTGNATKQGLHTDSKVLLDSFQIYNCNTTKQYTTISKNAQKNALGRLGISAYSEIEGFYRPMRNHTVSSVNPRIIQTPDPDAAPYDKTGVSELVLGNTGDGYDPSDPPRIVFSSGSGKGAKATVTMGDGNGNGTPTDRIHAITLTDSGTGYKSPPYVNFVGGGSPSVDASARAALGTSRLASEIVKKIPAPRYTSIGFDSIPSDMYTLYGNCGDPGGATTTTKIYGAVDYTSGDSMMAYNASGTVSLSKVHGQTSVSLAQTNPQTALFSSATDNELIGGKLKIYYNDTRAGDAGTSSAVRDIVAATNTVKSELGTPTAYVEVWPPLPLAPDTDDEWEIQSRSSVLFNGLITNQIHDVTGLSTPEFDYARPDYKSTIGSSEDSKVTRGIFNIGWNGGLTDVTTLPAHDATTWADGYDGSNDADVLISGTGGAPKGYLQCRYWDSTVSGQETRQGMRQAAQPNLGGVAFVAPNGATKAISVGRKGVSTSSNTANGPLGITRGFDTQVDLKDCDIMVVMRVPKLSEHPGTIFQIDPEGTANEQLNGMYGPPPVNTLVGQDDYAVSYQERGPEFACTLRVYDDNQYTQGTDANLGTFNLHKDNFMVKNEANVYKPSGNKGDAADGTSGGCANGHWIKLVFPTAGHSGMERVKEIEFSLNVNLYGNSKGAIYGHSGSNTGGQHFHIAGIHAIPRGTADVMAGFSNSQNAIGEISKESFLSVESGLHNLAKDGMHATQTGMSADANKANPKIAGLTIGGKGKIYTGYQLNGAVNDSATTITVDGACAIAPDESTAGDMGSDAADRAINVDDRLSFGVGSEILRVKTVASATSITVERGADGTTAETYPDNLPIYVNVPSDAEMVVKDYDYDVEGFSQKGFVNFGFSQNSGVRYNDSITWEKRENPLAAARLIEIIGYSEEGVKVAIDQPDIFACENDTNTTWCLYREQPREVQFIEGTGSSGDTSQSYLTTFTFNKSMLSGNVLTIPKTSFLDNLPDDTSIAPPVNNFFISPYKYWLYLRFSPKARGNTGTTIGAKNTSSDAVTFPKRSYKSLVRTENYLKGVSGTHNKGTSSATHYTLSPKDAGPTWNESVFNDGKYLNPWSMNFGEIRPSFEQSKDYGLGVFNPEENLEGGHAFENNAEVGWTENILPNVVSMDNLQPLDKVSFMITPQLSEQNYDFSINSKENSSNTPYLLTTFFDSLPIFQSFELMPDEETETFPKFKWNIQANDLWYGFLKIGTDAVLDQYHNKELHIPMNETTTAALTVNDSTTNVSSSDITMTREGLAGYAVDFNGTNSYLRYGTGSADSTPNCTTNMSVVAHIVPDSGASDNRYIISQEGTPSGKFHIRLNSSNQVESRVYYSNSSYVELTSGAIVPSDGYTPSVIILTVDAMAREGNVKLYVNGKLEDQTGMATSSGTTDNWKLDAVINGGADYLIIGNEWNYVSNGGNNVAFDGRIEEVVIYKDLIYPVDLSSGEYTLTKPLKELNTNGKRLSYNAVIFAKDYHNIRGEKPENVAKTDIISFSKSSPAVIGG